MPVSLRPSRRLIAASLAVIAWLVVCLGTAVDASAAPLGETEPNNDALHANGPFGSDGWTQTVSVSDDVDYILFRLQGRRQVALTTQGPASTPVGHCGSISFSSADGSFSRSAGIYSSPQTVSWTTPRDATEYIGYVRGPLNCTSLIRVSPGDALITGPLPAASYPRSLAVVAPGAVGEEATVPITVSGVAADDEQIAAQWRSGGCPAAPESSGGGTLVRGSLLAAGAYNVTLQTTSPSTAGPATLCTWLVDTLGKLEPLLRQQTVVVTAPPVDNDRDGVVTGPDCNDSDAAIKPGATEIPGNQVDENCDGVAAPYQPVPATVTLRTTPQRSGTTKLRALVLQQTSGADSVRVTCLGGGCRRSLRSLSTTGNSSGTLSLTARVNGMRLRTGATLSVRIARAGFRSRVFKYTMRRRAQPRLGIRCAAPGATATFPC